jgi:dGTPase
MDLSDDVAYSVHDLEDGIVAGRILVDWLVDPAERRAVWQTARDWYLPGADDGALEGAMERLWGSTPWPERPYDGSRRALAGMKNLTSRLIGRFCAAVQQATQEAYGAAPLTRYGADLVVPEDTALEIAALKAIAAHYVMRADDRQPVLQKQREILTELVSLIRLRSEIDPAFGGDFAAADSDAARLRVIVDQVASLTDASALAWHTRLT